MLLQVRNDKGLKGWNSEVGCKEKAPTGALTESQKGSVAMRLRGRGNMLIPWTKQGTQRVACADGSAGLMLGREGMESSESSPGRVFEATGRMRSSWMGACCCCLVSLGQEKEVELSRTPTVGKGRERRGSQQSPAWRSRRKV